MTVAEFNFINKVKNFLYKKKRKIHQLPNVYLKKILWEEKEDNLYYGHYNILKTYIKAYLPYKINGEVQHGWTADNSGIVDPDRSKKYYVFNEIKRNQ